MTTRFSDDTELFPLSALLHERDDETKEYGLPRDTKTGIRHIMTKDTMFQIPDKNGYYGGWIVNDTDGTITVYTQLRGENPNSHTLAPGMGLSIAGELAYIRWGTHTTQFTTSPFSIDEIYWNRFGIDQIELPPNTNFVRASWKRICLRVNESYYDRFLAGETVEQWQRHLQVIADNIIPTYERRYELYDGNSELLASLGNTQVTTYENVTDTSVSNAKTQYTDTPDVVVNNDDNYAGSISRTDNGGSNVRTGSVRLESVPAGGILPLIESNMSVWHDLETELVGEFAKAFLSLIWY